MRSRENNGSSTKHGFNGESKSGGNLNRLDPIYHTVAGAKERKCCLKFAVILEFCLIVILWNLIFV